MARTPTRPVQVRLPESWNAFLTQLAAETGQSKTQVVIQALECLQRSLLERRLEAAYSELAADRDQAHDQEELIRAGLAVTLPTIPD